MQEVKLPAYEGPLDLLLQLIQKNEIDIFNIPISFLTEKYTEEILRGGMEQMSEFLVMAAALLEIKARMLLPKPPSLNAEPEEDPRDELVRRLLEYKHCQSLAEKLKDITPGERITREGEAELIAAFTQKTPADALAGVDLDQLFRVFADVMLRRESRVDRVRAGFGEMPREWFTVAEKSVYIRNRLETSGRCTLAELFEDCGSRAEMVVTFLAVLELIRRGELKAEQQSVFAEVEIELKDC